MVENEQEQEIGRIEKIIFVDDQRRVVGEATPSGSKQLDEDPFIDIYDQTQLKEPPYSLEQFVALSERHPVHSAALEQKAMDIIGAGTEWIAEEDSVAADGTVDHSEAETLLRSLSGPDSDEEILEILHAMQLDFETTGQGYLEIIRDEKKVVKQLVHIPAHTMRVHKNKLKYAQVRGEKKVWFKKWGAEQDVDFETGDDLGEDAAGNRVANEVLVFKKPTRRSSYYGIPMWISATGWILLALAARDYNIMFFQNNREPRWAIVITDVQADANIVETLRSAFTVDLKQPHRNLIVPISGSGNVKFQKLGSEQVDATFKNLLQLCDDAILVGHRVPPERIGVARTGPLGGNVANVSNKVYREGVVTPSQALVEARMNRFLRAEFPEVMAGRKWSLIDLDLTAEDANVDKAVKLYRYDIAMRNEARKIAGLPPLPEDDPRGRVFMSEVMSQEKINQINAQADADEEAAAQRDMIAEVRDGVMQFTNRQNEEENEDLGPRPSRPAPGTAGDLTSEE